MANKMTVTSPNHEWRLYRFGMGLGWALLCESKTAFKAMVAKKKAEIMTIACVYFSLFFRSFRKTRYNRIPAKLKEEEKNV